MMVIYKEYVVVLLEPVQRRLKVVCYVAHDRSHLLLFLGCQTSFICSGQYLYLVKKIGLWFG